MEAEESDVSELEGIGAMNFLTLDDFTVIQEGEKVDPSSVINLPVQAGSPIFPRFEASKDDPFLLRVNRSGKKWVIIVDDMRQPRLVLNANAFLRAALFSSEVVNPHHFCHRPIIVRDIKTLLGNVLSDLKVYADSESDDVVDHDIILIWAEQRRVITGADILGRLLRGISHRSVNSNPA
jgi:metal transporter CNNM